MAPKKTSQEAVLDPEVGELCFFLNPDVHSWVPGTVISWDPKVGASCKAFAGPADPNYKWEDGKVVEKLPADQVLNIQEEIMKENVEDLLSLTVLHDSTILNVLRKRYLENLIYTNIGAITVALNPFNFKIPYYTDDNMPKYLAEGDRIERNMPHSWAVAHNTYWEMRNASIEPINQCILVSGESGAGKTEASKIVMKYLACLSCKEGTQEQKEAGLGIGKKIEVTSPPLEAFGNAKTSRNDNSSRFGKWMQVKFDSLGFLVGADITKYLLEKSRIITAAQGERCYHSFYILCRAKQREKWGVSMDADPTLLYSNTSAGKVSANKDFDTQEEFDEVQESFSKLAVSDDTVDAVWSVVAGIMFAENVTVEADGEGSKFTASAGQWVDRTVAAWKIEKATFEKEFLTQTLHTKEGSVLTKLNTVKALDGRSALTKTLYDNQFQWLIDTCNKTIDKDVQGGRWVGLLDIFGFEDFEVNSFEQLCINLANESLQCHYNEYIFSKDMDECRAEGIDVAEVVFPDNTPCLQMISAKGGIFALLDEECALGQGTDLQFLDKVADKVGGNAKYKKFFLKKQLAKTSFIVNHYAGSVSYDVAHFLDKNRDTLKPEYKLMLRASTDPFIAELLPPPEDSAKKMTVGAFFKSQVALLMDKINSTNPHWIRCIKPHPAKKPLHFHGIQTMKQLSSSGVLGTVMIRKAGFPVRIPFPIFYEYYRIIAAATGQQLDPSDPRACATAIIQVAKIDKAMGQIGTSRVFLKNDAYIHLEKEKKRYLALSAEVVQAWCHGLFAGKRFKEVVNEANRSVIADLREKAIAALAERRAKEKAERERRAKAEREEKEREEKNRKEREKSEREQREREEMIRMVAEREKRAKHYDSALIIQKRVRGMLARISVSRMYLEILRVRYEALVEKRMEEERRKATLLDEARRLHEAEHEALLTRERFKQLQNTTRVRMVARKESEAAKMKSMEQAARRQAAAMQQNKATLEAMGAEEARSAQMQRHEEAQRNHAAWQAARKRKEQFFQNRSAASDQRSLDLPAAYAYTQSARKACRVDPTSDSVQSDTGFVAAEPVPPTVRNKIGDAGAKEGLFADYSAEGQKFHDSNGLRTAALGMLKAWQGSRTDVVTELASRLVIPEACGGVSPVAVLALAVEAAGGLRKFLGRLWTADGGAVDRLAGFADAPHPRDRPESRVAYNKRVRSLRNRCLYSDASAALHRASEGDSSGLAGLVKTIGVSLALTEDLPDAAARGPLFMHWTNGAFADAEDYRRVRKGGSVGLLSPAAASTVSAEHDYKRSGYPVLCSVKGIRRAINAGRDKHGEHICVLPPLAVFEVLSDGQLVDGRAELELRYAASGVVVPEIAELTRLAEAEFSDAERRLHAISKAIFMVHRVQALPSTNKQAMLSNRRFKREALVRGSPEGNFEQARSVAEQRELWMATREHALAESWTEAERIRRTAQGMGVPPPALSDEQFLSPPRRQLERSVQRSLRKEFGVGGPKGGR
eukprot:Hpha_TRINITY_DN15334_c6_g1::TRINITY_DN15334_c6_g1_i1::g.90833::m.90833/K10357/MYO5; myosin V